MTGTTEVRQPRRRPRHPARGSRLVVAGASVATTLGIMAALRHGDTIGSTNEAAPVSFTPSEVVVVVHQRRPATLASARPAPTPADRQPVALHAVPRVTTVYRSAAPGVAAPEPAPVTTTHGSR